MQKQSGVVSPLSSMVKKKTAVKVEGQKQLGSGAALYLQLQFLGNTQILLIKQEGLHHNCLMF